MRFNNILSALAVILFIPCTSNAQNSIEVSPLSGISVFSPGKVSLTGRTYGIEAVYNVYLKGRTDEWIKKLGIRDMSIVGSYRNMRQVEIEDSVGSKGFLGSIYTLSQRSSFSLLNFGRTEVLLTTALGLTYSTTSYFATGNPIVGSRINFSAQLGPKLRTPFSREMFLTAGADVFHYSNIALKVPNHGVNSFELSFGVIREFKNSGSKVKHPAPDSLRGFIELGADIGRRGVFKSKEGNWKSGLYAGYNYRINRAISIKAGTDAVYYYTPFTGAENTFQYSATSYDRWRYGLSLGTELWAGKFITMASYGYYLKFNSYYPVNDYWTAGLKYYTSSWLGFQGKMYFHKAQADYVGFGIMARIPTQNFR